MSVNRHCQQHFSYNVVASFGNFAAILLFAEMMVMMMYAL
jgi:hypothetical protein